MWYRGPSPVASCISCLTGEVLAAIYRAGVNEDQKVMKRHETKQVRVGNLAIGGNAPIRVQSMTNTDTADIEATVSQIAALAQSGSELVRITVDRKEAARAVPFIKERLDTLGVDVPIIGDRKSAV